VGCSRSQYAFHRMVIGAVLVIIQKTKDAEPVGPVQHLLFYCTPVIDNKCAGASVGVAQCNWNDKY
jgi:hypothetical protein